DPEDWRAWGYRGADPESGGWTPRVALEFGGGLQIPGAGDALGGAPELGGGESSDHGDECGDDVGNAESGDGSEEVLSGDEGAMRRRGGEAGQISDLKGKRGRK